MLDRLSADRATLFVSLLLLDALFRPYTGLIHDAQLYAVQVLDRVSPGQYSDDLYLRYGSQDRYTVFSWLVSPVVEVVGLPAAFFLLYLLSNAVFLYGLLRFTQAVVKPRALAALAVIWLALNPIPFGGLGVFDAHETFLTPRLFANGLTLLALERLLRGRAGVSFTLLAAAMAIHPIMAVCGLLAWLCWQALEHFSRGTFAALAAVCGLAALGCLLYAPLGTALFGPMDETWRRAIHAVNLYSLPAEWTWRDWLRIAVAFGVVVAARRGATGLKSLSQNLEGSLPRARDSETTKGFRTRTKSLRRLFDAVAIVAAAGIGLGCVTPYLPYALLFQGQPYRALWLLQVVATCAVFMLAGRVSSANPRVRALAFSSVAAFALVSMTGRQWIIAALLAVLGAMWRRSHSQQSLAGLKILAAAGALVLLAPEIVSAFYAFYQLAPSFPAAQCFTAIPNTLGPFVTWLAAIGVLLALRRLAPTAPRFRLAALAGCLAVQTAFFVVPCTPLGAWIGARRSSDVAFVEQYLQRRRAESDHAPTIYWAGGDLDDIWLALGCQSYYVTRQMVGNMFNRPTAMEGQRRARRRA